MAQDSLAPKAHPSQTSTRTLLFGWMVAFATSFALYAATASRGAQWQDPGMHLQRILSGSLVNPLGLALSHPLHFWLGRIASLLHPANPAFAITLISGLAGAITVANTFGLIWSITRFLPAAAFGAASLALAHTFWQMATITETYTLVTAILSGEMWCAILFLQLRGPHHLLLAFALNGLGLANHNVALLTAPILVFILFLHLWRGALTWRFVLGCAICWLVGSLPYTGLVFSELLHADAGVEVIRSALFGHAYAEEVLNVFFSARRLVVSTCFIGLNFPNLALPLAALGMLWARKLALSLRLLLYAALAIHFVFAIRYPVLDQHTFFLPAYLLLAIFAGLGLMQLARQETRGARLLQRAAFVLLLGTPLIYAFVPALARHFDALTGYARNKPFRDDYVYIFTPWSFVDRSAEQLGRHALEIAGPSALIIAPDTMSAPAIWYQARITGSQGVEVTGSLDPDLIANAVSDRRRVIYVPRRTDEEPDPVASGMWRRQGGFFVLEPAGSTPGGNP